MIARVVWALLLLAGTLAFALGHDAWDRPLVDPQADASYYYAYVPSLVLDGDLDLANQYAVTGDWYSLGTTPTGRRANVFGIGPAIAELPLFVVGHAVARVTGARADGFSRWETGLCLWLSVLASVAALVPATRLARRHVTGELAPLVGPILAALAGPVLYYAIRQPGYAHPLATLGAAWLVERWDSSFTGAPRTMRTWLVLGAIFGGCVLVRPQLATWGLLFVFAAIDDLRCGGSWLRWLAAAGVALAMFVPQLVAWRCLYGAWYVVPQGPGFLRWDAPMWAETLFSSRNGLLPWAPLYGPMFLGLFVVRTPRARLVVALGLGLLAQAVVNGAAWDWWAGGSFGGRRFDSTFILFALGASALLRVLLDAALAIRAAGARWWRRLLGGVAALAIFAGLLVTFATASLAADTDVTNARLGGGAPASASWEHRVGGLSGYLAAWLSLGDTLVPRAWFAWRNHTGIGDYDFLVGVHILGENYPHLTRLADTLEDHIKWNACAPPFFTGLAPTSDRSWALVTADRARIFVGLNRPGGLRLRFAVQATGPLTVRWNDSLLATKTFAGSGAFDLHVDDPVRGVNWLTIDAPPGTRLGTPQLTADP